MKSLYCVIFLEVYFQILRTVMKSLAVIIENSRFFISYTPCVKEKVLKPGSVIIGSPLTPVFLAPDTNIHPNWKFDPFWKHLDQGFIKVVHFSENVSCDEQTIWFHGLLKHKSRFKFKKIGDGSQAGSICCKGYTYAFYFRH